MEPIINPQWLQENRKNFGDDFILKELAKDERVGSMLKRGGDINSMTKAQYTQVLDRLAGLDGQQTTMPQEEKKQGWRGRAFDFVTAPGQLAVGAIEKSIGASASLAGKGLSKIGAGNIGSGLQAFGEHTSSLTSREDMNQALENTGDIAQVAVPVAAGILAAPAVAGAGLVATGAGLAGAGAAGGFIGSATENITGNLSGLEDNTAGDIFKEAAIEGAIGGAVDSTLGVAGKVAGPIAGKMFRGARRAFTNLDDAARYSGAMKQNIPAVNKAMNAGTDPKIFQFLGLDENVFKAQKVDELMQIPGYTKARAIKEAAESFAAPSSVQKKAYMEGFQSAVQSKGVANPKFTPNQVTGKYMLDDLKNAFDGMKEVATKRNELIKNSADEIIDITDTLSDFQSFIVSNADSLTTQDKTLIDTVVNMLKDKSPQISVKELSDLQTRMFAEIGDIISDPSQSKGVRQSGNYLKNVFRKSLNQKIDDVIPGYLELSTQYAKGSDAVQYWKKVLDLNVNSVDEFSEAISSAKKEKLGLLARRLNSNAQTGQDLATNIAKLQETLIDMGKQSDIDYGDLAGFNEAMNQMFGLVKDNSLQGTLQKTDLGTSIIRIASKIVDSLSGVSDKEKVNVLQNLLKAAQ